MAKREPPAGSWIRKFRCASAALSSACGESSFSVHFFVAALVLAAALVLQATMVEWCLLLLCIALVLTTEMINSALERMAKAVDENHNPHLRNRWISAAAPCSWLRSARPSSALSSF